MKAKKKKGHLNSADWAKKKKGHLDSADWAKKKKRADVTIRASMQ